MPSLITRVATFAACTFAPLWALADAVTLRALEVPDAQLDEFIATQALPMDLRNSIESLAPTATLRQVIKRFCGDVRPGYLRQFLAANSLVESEIDRKSPEDREVIWPACLFARDYRSGPPEMITVKSKDAYWSLHKRFTGRSNFNDASFFFLPQDQLHRKLAEGESVRIAYVTQPSNIRTRSAQTMFFAGLAEAIGKDWRQRLDVLPPSVGRILTAFRASAGDVPPCKPGTKPPFEGAKVLQAYLFSLAGRVPSTASVYVIDNGFFGADPRGSGDAFLGSAFEMQYFRPPGMNSSSQLIAATTNLSSKDLVDEDLEIDVHSIQPVNFLHFLLPDELSGHGTHVAGLALGGYYFREQRARMPLAGNIPWLQLTIVNVGKGGDTLLPNAHTEIFNVLGLSRDSSHIVNMSLVYEDDKARSTFEEVVRMSNKGTLFVVAAGNSGKPVPDAWMPVTQGGRRSEKVLTVAALDGEGHIAPFSSYSTDYVDLAAPGCALKSWIANDNKEVELSGTSMATPLVSFAASLLRSLRPEAEAKVIKARLVASGDLLAREDRDKTMSKVALNLVKSLYVDQDLLVSDDGGYLGEVLLMPRAATQCGPNREQRNQDGIWSYKRHETGALIHYGRADIGAVVGNCDVRDSTRGELTFGASYRIEEDQIVKLPRRVSMSIPMERVREIVFRMP